MIIMFFSGILVSCHKAEAPLEKSVANARIVFLKGEVALNGVKVKSTGQEVRFQDVIETGKGASCRIQIDSKAIMELKENSRLVYRISLQENILQLDKGWLAGVNNKVFTKQQKYQIKTPTVVAGVRGTSYCIKVEDVKSTYFCVCNGEIHLQGEGTEKGTVVSAEHHAGRRFIRNQDGKVQVQNAGMEYHQDDTIEALHAILGEKVDWKKVHKVD